MPYLFLKPSRGAVVGNGDPVVIPYGRNRTDWEVELAAVVGRTAKYVPATSAQDYILRLHGLDRRLRSRRAPPRWQRHPLGLVRRQGPRHVRAARPLEIVPKEFYGDPMQNLRQTLSVGGTTLQDAQAGDMIHSLWEIVEYASSIITLHPGDVINNGTSGGTAAGSAETRTGSRYLQPGEVIEASIDGIGTLRMPAVAGDMPTDELTGAQLPPMTTTDRSLRRRSLAPARLPTRPKVAPARFGAGADIVPAAPALTARYPALSRPRQPRGRRSAGGRLPQHFIPAPAPRRATP